jgi:Uma2 family endonuclease
MSLELEPIPDVGEAVTCEMEEDRKGYELIDGDWVEKPMGTQAAVVTNNVQVAITPFVRRGRLGHVVNAEGGYRLFPDNPKLIRKPDVSFVAAGRFPNDQVPRGNALLAPDLAVEVVSPNDLAEAADAKIGEYLAAGVRLIWVLYVPSRSVWVVKPDGTAVRRAAGDQLTGEDVLPGFTVRVEELFEGV